MSEKAASKSAVPTPGHPPPAASQPLAQKHWGAVAAAQTPLAADVGIAQFALGARPPAFNF